jgi:enoyl-CoA hydratase/carnithine racemase
VANAEAKFTVAYVRVGLSPDGGVTHFLRAALPRQLVNELCVLGRPITAERLAQFGVVNEVTELNQALDGAMTLAGKVAAGPANAIRSIKNLVNTAADSELSTHLSAEADLINQARFGPEAAEGLSAFLEKRKPDFRKI